MPTITLTDFVDVVQKSGVPKATKIAELKHRPDYSPATDFYKPLREAIQRMHQKGLGKATLDSVLTGLTHKAKLDNYPATIDGYKKWLGKKSFPWFDPEKDEFVSAGVAVSINPELGLELAGTRHLVKLYFKADPLAKARARLVVGIMEDTLRPLVGPNVAMSVLDIRRSKLHTGAGPDPLLTAMVHAELAYVASLWPSV